jgi:hypothetical protein
VWNILDTWISGSEIKVAQEESNLGLVRRQLAINKLLGLKNRAIHVSKA